MGEPGAPLFLYIINMSYVYLNRYADGSLYVGKHHYSGKGLDPEYHGSSHLVKEGKFTSPLVEETILYEGPDYSKKEVEFIQKYCSEYGVHPLVLTHLAKFGATSKYKLGIVLNIHAMDGFVDPSVGGKASWESGAAARNLAKANTAESHRKAVATRLAKDGYKKQTMEWTHTPEAIAKRVSRTDYKSMTRKRDYTKSVARNTLIDCYYQGKLVCTGNTVELPRKLSAFGFSVSQSSVSQLVKRGKTSSCGLSFKYQSSI